MPVYNRNAHGLPSLGLPRLTDLKLTEHVRVRALERGVPLDLLRSFDPVTYPIFQVETDDLGTLLKINYRKRMTSKLDYCAVISPSLSLVISTWVQYNTFIPFIDRANFDKPPKGMIVKYGIAI